MPIAARRQNLDAFRLLPDIEPQNVIWEEIMVRKVLILTLAVAGTWGVWATATAAPETTQASCVGCHKAVTPALVADWQVSKHAANDVDCAACHGDQHRSAADTAKALIPTRTPAPPVTKTGWPSSGEASTLSLGQP